MLVSAKLIGVDYADQRPGAHFEGVADGDNVCGTFVSSSDDRTNNSPLVNRITFTSTVLPVGSRNVDCFNIGSFDNGFLPCDEINHAIAWLKLRAESFGRTRRGRHQRPNAGDVARALLSDALARDVKIVSHRR